MPVTPDQLRAEIITEVGDPNNTLTAIVALTWDIYADKATIDPSLQVLYVKRAALDARLAEEWDDTDVTLRSDVADAQSQRFTHLQQMRVDTQAEIVRVEALSRANRVPMIGALTKTEPISPCWPGEPDLNSGRFRGLPYDRRSQWS
jgi:hypothetical protein